MRLTPAQKQTRFYVLMLLGIVSFITSAFMLYWLADDAFHTNQSVHDYVVTVWTHVVPLIVCGFVAAARSQYYL